MLPYIVWLSFVVALISTVASTVAGLTFWVPLVSWLLTIRTVPVELWLRFGQFVIFHERHVDVRGPSSRSSVRIAYERIVAFREAPDVGVEIAYLLAPDNGDLSENLRSEIVRPEDAAGVMNEMRLRLADFYALVGQENAIVNRQP